MTGARKRTLLAFALWLLLLALTIAELGSVPGSPFGWGLLIVLGPGAYLVATAVGELGLNQLSSLANKLRLGRSGRVLLLLLVLFPVLFAYAYIANR